jgi:hypothetical protein
VRATTPTLLLPKPIKQFKDLKGRFEQGHLKSIPDWYIEKLSRSASALHMSSAVDLYQICVNTIPERDYAGPH